MNNYEGVKSETKFRKNPRGAKMRYNTIYEGDCILGLKKLPDNSVDCIVTSPPYNKNGFRNGRKDPGKSSSKYKRWDGAKIDYDSYEDNMPEEKYRDWQIKLLNECFRVLKPTGSLFYNHKVRRFESRADHPLVWLSKSKLHFYQQIIWDRGGAPDQNINYCTPSTELILWFVKDRPKTFKTKHNYYTEVWKFNPAKSNHPAPFPKILVRNCLNLTTEVGDVVLDPFMGSGTTAKACYELNRRFIGFEISPKYNEMAIKKLSQENLTGFFGTQANSTSSSFNKDLTGNSDEFPQILPLAELR